MKDLKDEHEFERLLKDKADGFSLKPSPEVWQGVHSSLQPARRPWWHWGLMSALMLAVSGSAAYFILEKHRGTEKQISEISDLKRDQGGKTAGAISNDIPEENTTQKNSSLTSTHRKPLALRDDHSAANMNGGKTFEGQITEQNIPLIAPDDKIAAVPKNMPGINLTDIAGSIESGWHLPAVVIKPGDLYFEMNAMAIGTHTQTKWKRDVASPGLPPDNSSIILKGFSVGGNLLYKPNDVLIFGIGSHYTNTYHEAITGMQSIPLYDSTVVYDGNSYVTEMIYSGDSLIADVQHTANDWLEVTALAGIELFSDSKNHLRILGGGGYSRLLKNSNTASEKTADVSAGGNVGLMNVQPVTLTYTKNQIKLFSEVSYQRDFTDRFSVNAGMQVHYYPKDLLSTEQLSQNMIWLGLKGGLIFKL